MAYEVIIKPSAEKTFGKLPNALQVKTQVSEFILNKKTKQAFE